MEERLLRPAFARLARLRIPSLPVWLLCVVAFASVGGNALASPTDPVQVLARGNTLLALRVYKGLSSLPGNVFFSPYSVARAMTMTYAGARGNTAVQMRGALGYQIDDAGLHDAFRRLSLTVVESIRASGQKFQTADGLCLTGGDLAQDYTAFLRRFYDAEVFRGGLDEVNGWVRNRTEGRIPSILEKLDPNSVCVLLDAVYFKGIWEQRFDPAATKDAPFHLRPANGQAETALVPTMHRKGHWRFYEGPGFQALELPYAGATQTRGAPVSMILFLPEEAVGMARMEAGLLASVAANAAGPDAMGLADVIAALEKRQPQEVDLWLPRFGFEAAYNLVPTFRAMGIQDAFDTRGAADFSGMGWRKGDLWISQIRHRAMIEVNEEGTEAAAATAVEMATKGFSMPEVFRADHPFLLAIVEKTTSSILFLGRVDDPRKQ